MASSRSPFHGDESGDIFNHEKNALPQTKPTDYHNLETQSGFELVLKKIKNKTMFLVKRKIGTPPTSQIILTPDEANRFAHILTNSESAGNEANINDQASSSFADFDEFSLENYRASRSKNNKKDSKLHKSVKIIAVIVAIKVLVLIGLVFGGISHFGQPKPITSEAILNDKKIITMLTNQFIISFYECQNYNLPAGQIIQTLSYLNNDLKEFYTKDFFNNAQKPKPPNNLKLSCENLTISNYSKNSRLVKFNLNIITNNQPKTYNIELVISVQKNVIGIPQVLIDKISPAIVKF